MLAMLMDYQPLHLVLLWQVFMMDGVGATGVATPHSASYGASKRALPQLTLSLAKECKGTGVSVHIVSPGMVMTDLLCTEENLEKRNTVRIFNILAELPQTVSDWMVPRMRGITGTGKYFRFLTAHGVVWRFATMAWRKDRLLKMPPHRIKGE